MRIILALVIILALAGAASAAPFLAGNVQPEAEWVEVEGLPFLAGKRLAVPLHEDIAAMAPGTAKVRARACTELWGCSDWSPFIDVPRPDLTRGVESLGLSPQ